MTDIYEYRRNTINRIEDLINSGGLASYEVTDKIKELSKDNADLKNWAERLITWRDIIWNSEDAAFMDKIYENMYGLIKNIMKEKHEREMDKEKKRHQENVDWWKEYYRGVNEREEADKEWWRNYNAKQHDWQKNIQKQEEENNKRIENNKKDFLKENQDDDIDKVETELRKMNGKVSEADLNKKLGVSDWREKIKQTTDIVKSQRRRFEIEKAIEQLNSEIVCDYCNETKSPYPASSYEIPSKKKKFCSLDCQNTWEKENNKDDQKSPSTNPKNNFGVSDINQFFAWIKKMGVVEMKFDFNTNQVVFKCDNNKQLSIDDSGLSTEEKQKLTQKLKSIGTPITQSDISKELGKDKKNNGNGGIIAAIVVVGLILAVVIGAVVYKSRKKDY